MGLALAQKRKPLAPLTPSLPRQAITDSRNKVNRFLDRLKTPEQLRNMSEFEMGRLDKENFYDGVEIAEEAHETESGSQNKNLSVSRKKNRA